MNGRTIFGTFAILLSLIQLNGLPMSKGRPTSQISALGRSHQVEANMDQVLDATVEIEMSLRASVETSGEHKLLGNGLGSLVWSEGKLLLVTHNHWGDVLKEQTVIVFYDNERRVIKIMLGNEFQRLVVYQDAGTLVLKAPDEMDRLIEPIRFHPTIGKSKKVKVGDTVLLTYHQKGGRAKIGLLKARVESISEYKELPVFVLRSLDGTPILQGDSGGGIWHNGKLVGNMWATIVKDTPDRTLSITANSTLVQQVTDQSFGAMFPEAAGESR